MTADNEAKRPVGRPSLYKPEYCDSMVAFCRKGYSITAYAGEIGVSRECLTEWGRVHEEFSVALKRAKAAAARWWEDKGRTVGEGDGGPGAGTMVVFQLKNMAGDDFSEKVVNEHTGKDGSPIQFTDDARVRALTAFLEKTGAKI